MTEQKHPRKRVHTGSLRYRVLVETFKKDERKQKGSENERRGALPEKSAPQASPRTKRVVSTPQERAEPQSWNALADRRASLRRKGSRPAAPSKLVPRTFAQTGVSATAGQIRRQRPLARREGRPLTPSRAQVSQKRNAFLRILGILLGVLLLALGLRYILTSPLFQVQQVSVEGTKNPTLKKKIEMSSPQGQNIFLLDTTSVINRVASIPQIESVQLTRHWPNHLTISVVERTPILLWQTSRGSYSVDKQGVVISATGDNTTLIKVIDMRQQTTGIDLTSNGEHQTIQPGVKLDSADVQFALKIHDEMSHLTSLKAYTLRYAGATSGKNQQGASRSFVIESPDGWKALLGNADNENPLENQLSELQQILTVTQKQQVKPETIDLRFGLRPAYTLK